LSNFKTQLAIVSNPHTKNPKQLWDILNKPDEEQMSIEEYAFDSAGFENLKHAIGGTSGTRIVVKS
jgi:hypothetical protein